MSNPLVIGTKALIKGADEASKAGKQTADGFSDEALQSIKPPTPTIDMSYQARMERSNMMGFDTEAYHGTTHDFKEFTSSRLEKGGHFGGGHELEFDKQLLVFGVVGVR